MYTKQQNKRRLEVNIRLNESNCDPQDITVGLSAFNSGFRSVAIINYEFLVEDKIIDFDHIFFPEGEFKLPYSIKEGEIALININAANLANWLKNKEYNGIVKLSGYYETAQNKKYSSKSIEFNIKDWKHYFI